MKGDPVVGPQVTAGYHLRSSHEVNDVYASAILFVSAKVVVERKLGDATRLEQVDGRRRSRDMYPSVWRRAILEVVVEPDPKLPGGERTPSRHSAIVAELLSKLEEDLLFGSA